MRQTFQPLCMAVSVLIVEALGRKTSRKHIYMRHRGESNIFFSSSTGHEWAAMHWKAYSAVDNTPQVHMVLL